MLVGFGLDLCGFIRITFTLNICSYASLKLWKYNINKIYIKKNQTKMYLYVLNYSLKWWYMIDEYSSKRKWDNSVKINRIKKESL